MDRLKELMGHVRRCHSATQIHHFIVVKGGAFCDYGALRQALRETHTRVGVVRECLLRIAEAELDSEEAEDALPYSNEIEYAIDTDDRERCRKHSRAKIATVRAQTRLDDLRDDLRERSYELSHFYAISCALKDEVEKRHGELTPELHASLDMTMWVHRMRMNAAHDLMTHGRVQSSTLQTVQSLPAVFRKQLTHQINDPKGLIEWAGDVEYTLPEIQKVLTEEEVCAYVADADRACIGAS